MPEVVFLPGFMQHADTWSPIAAAIRERYPVRLLEFATWTFEGRLGEIRAVGEGGVLVGYSMGGRLALHAAVRWPDAFAGLAVLGASGGVADPDGRRRADEELARWIETHPIEDVVAHWEQNPVFASQSAELVEAQRAGRLDHDPVQVAALLRTAGQGALPPIWSEIAELRRTVPLLAMAGSDDPLYVEAARTLTKGAGPSRIPQPGEGPAPSLRVVEGCGHAAHLERPDLVAQALLEFLDEHFGDRVVGDVDA